MEDHISGGKRRRGTAVASEEVKWSKKLAWALRHRAIDLGLNMDSAGFVSVDELLGKNDFRGLSFDLLKTIVTSNAKKRFELVTISDGDDAMLSSSKCRIRAVQGHSIKAVDDESLLTPILSTEDLWAKTASRILVHGTYRRHLTSICNEGLRCMGRNHMHLAIRLSNRHVHLLGDGAGESKLGAEEATVCGDGEGEGGVEVISGLRESCEVAIVIDLVRAFDDGVKFFLAKNLVVLTRGLGEGGVLPPRYFLRVIALDGKPLP